MSVRGSRETVATGPIGGVCASRKSMATGATNRAAREGRGGSASRPAAPRTYRFCQ